jgi:hypothetical protein
MTKKSDHLEVVDTTGLTDADWAEINKSKNAYDVGGQKALSAALDDLAKDPSRTARVLGALFPDLVREATKDKMAPRGGLNFAREALLDCRRGRGQRAPWSLQGARWLPWNARPPASTRAGMSHINDPKHWRHRAEEARAMAESLTDPEAKQLMLNVAADYEKLAKRAEERSTGVRRP